MNSEEAIRYYLGNSGFSGTLKDLLELRFGMIRQVDESKTYYLPRQLDLVMKDLSPYLDEIYYMSRTQKEFYKQYIKSIDSEYMSRKIGVVDIGYSGTIQYYFSNILNKKFTGYYFALSDSTHPSKNNQKCVPCFYQRKKDYPDPNPWLLIEAILTAPYGQFSGFDKSGNKIFSDDFSTEMLQRNRNLFFRGIKSFINDISISMNTAEIDNINFSKGLGLDLLKFFYSESEMLPIEVKNIFEVETTFNGGKMKNKIFK